MFANSKQHQHWQGAKNI